MRNASVASSGIACLIALAAFGCSTHDGSPSFACEEADAAYEVMPLVTFEGGEADIGDFWDPWTDGNEGLQLDNLGEGASWPEAPDSHYLGSEARITNEEIPEETKLPCTGQRALVAYATKVDRYGGAFGGAFTHDGSAWEGIGFWARAGNGSAAVATIGLADIQTELLINIKDPVTGEQYCYLQYADRVTIVTDAEGNKTTVPGPDGLPDPDASPEERGQDIDGDGLIDDIPIDKRCGNHWRVILEASHQWEFYVFPWDEWFQLSCTEDLDRGCEQVKFDTPGATFDRIMPDQLRTMYYAFAKFAETEIWIDSIHFYRRRQ